MTATSSPSPPPSNARDATTFLFGGHIGTQTKQTLERAVRSIVSGPNGKWMLDAIAELPKHWDALVEKMPEAGVAVPGARLLADLDAWLRSGISSDGSLAPDEELPNILIGPLMVAIQLDQYWSYLEYRRGGARAAQGVDLQAELVQQNQLGISGRLETLGFCAGLIGAVAVAGAHNRQDFEKYGAVALRLGMLMAGLVDACEEWDKGLGKGGSVSFATAWRTLKQGRDMLRIISSLSPDPLSPEAYVAVLFDETRATVTTSERTAPTLVRQLRAAGVTAIELGFKGHLHTPGAGRKRHTEALIDVCHGNPELQFPEAARLALSTYSNQAEGKPVPPDRADLTGMVLRSILMHQSNWYGTFSTLVGNSQDVSVVTFGLDRCVPPTLVRHLGPKQVHFEELEMPPREAPSSPQQQKQPQQNGAAIPRSTQKEEEAIAIVGMSIKVAGADDVDEFAAMLKTGASQHEVITRERLMHDMLFRENAGSDPNKKYYGNFLRDSDAFDHKFFKRSPRESQTMDPQSRLSMQAAYQAVEQSGYFAETSSPSTEGRDRGHVGVYIGICGVDYEQNITCHSPNAFTATGGLRSFIAGRLSHYFGWTGPAMTFDTACSSSFVAIHTACRNLLSGEATAALCGGANIVTNMQWMQNLSAGSFLSPTGQCKPFDAAADGYCRAEGIAFVFLKKLSDAVADGNNILGTIRATAVYQNQNITPLFVPNTPSLSRLFKDVIRKARVEPRDISLVEAHGTGTPVGDPAEYESVRLAVAGPLRDTPVPIGSVKGHIGHTEGASGAIALVKVLMMMRENFIPPQASFSRINPHIHASPADMMEVVTSLRPWQGDDKLALLNNYGACGSNASMVVGYSAEKPTKFPSSLTSSPSRYPFWITGFDARSIAAYSAVLATYLRSSAGAGDAKPTLADLSFNVSRQSNRGLPSGLMFSCRSLAELQDKISQAALSAKDTAASAGIAVVKPERPVVLCFGGQVSTFVGLDRKLYDSVAVLRRHLDECDAAIASLGLESIFPDIFSRQPIGDTVKLQTALFAMQYACAKSWMDCGLGAKVVSVVGHSFGEITALCVTGVLSLQDTIKLVAGRAKLVRDAWGADAGAMMALEADEPLVHMLLGEANLVSDGSAGIACYNGPRSFTLAGSTRAIDSVAATLGNSSWVSRGIKSKRLNVTNAFHSTLVEPLVDRLGELGRGLTFHDAAIPIERATDHGEPTGTAKLDWTFVPSHMRRPVFFNHAVQRLAKQHPRAIFLEAGSNSTITVMASRALAQTATTPDALHFQAVSITNTDGGLDGLTDATVALWKQGLRITYWAHHPAQAPEYQRLLLPPYQFEKSRHWLEMKSPAEFITKAAQDMLAAGGYGLASSGAQQDQQDPKTLGLWTFLGYDEENKKQGSKRTKGSKNKARFRINTASERYNRFFSAHVIAQTAPICPATLALDIAIDALFSLHPGWVPASLSPTVHDLLSHSPICADSTRILYLDLAPLDKAETQWHFAIYSEGTAGGSDAQSHVEARLHMRSPTDPAFTQEFGRYERLVSHSRCQDLLRSDLDDDGVEVLQGRNVYHAFREVVDFGDLYRGVRCIVGRDDESAGVVHKRHQGTTWLDVPLSDSFGQVAGIYVNLMTDLPSSDMFVATGCELVMRSPKTQTRTDGEENGPGVWHVFARHLRQSDKAYVADVFVFDAATGALTDIMIGLQYARVSRASMSKMLARLTTDESYLRTGIKSAPSAAAPPLPAISSSASAATSSLPVPPKRPKMKPSKKAKVSGRRDITEEVRNLVAHVSGIEASEMTLDSEMADLGIDSLMGMELAREVENTFKCQLDQAEQMEATSLRQFVACVTNALARAGGGDVEPRVESGESEDDDGSSPNGDERGIAWSDQNLDDGTASDISTPDEESDFTTDKQAAIAPASNISPGVSVSNLSLSPSDILECFGEVKLLTDDKMREFGLDSMAKVSLAGSNRLVTALLVEALAELGMPLGTAIPGQPLERVPFLPQHGCMMDFVYEFLERDARLIDVDIMSGQLSRTHIAVPRKTSKAALEELLVAHPESAVSNRLAYYAGKNLAGVLSGKTDGIRVIFGSPEGRELVQAMYCDYAFNRMHYQQMAEVISRLADRLKRKQPGEVLKVLEMGAGTGGTTNYMAPLLASLGMPVEYTFTDLSASMVAHARRKFGKQYPFMRFAVHDIEKSPADEHRDKHLVLASNAIHATHSLVASMRNVRQALRPDGFAMMLEMTEPLPFVDIVFGLLEGWWLFDDGRKHAVVPAEHWERELHAAGFGHVDWTDGDRPENAFQKVIIALASGPPTPRYHPKPTTKKVFDRGDVEAREAEAERLVATYTAGWATPALDAAEDRDNSSPPVPGSKAVVIVTGTTGSLGSHLVQILVERPDIATVVCVNRRSSVPVDKRQADALSSRGIKLSPAAEAKLRVLETDTSAPQLGLPAEEYSWLVQRGTHIVHNAWPMSGTRPLKAFEPQVQTMRNLLDLARDMATRGTNTRIGFQFVSSIGVVGYSAEPRVLEDRVPIPAVLPGGYTEAKWVCERMLDETLHRYPGRFRATVTRPGQIAGSTTSGVWNPVEHFAFLVKSAQTLRVWPNLKGVLQWLPVDRSAVVMVDLLKIEAPTSEAYPVYHIDNPVGQSWEVMSKVLADALGIPRESTIPFERWIESVRRSPVSERDNPAVRVVDFLEGHFERMSCGGIILDTSRAKQHSESMAREGPVSEEVARRYVAAWKEMGFLN